ncbi:MAG: prepilin-type N-terminal cleavage/methylation domain-containing protein, partial [Phycisphaerae bacterium]|nr:prepilin-type N-terminal cleavage/methylation domain-containing protein [Phycisphaerae bacterium]
MRRRAFTMIELAVVVFLIGLLATGVGWTMAERHRSVLLEDVIHRIAHVDQTARAFAQRFNRPVALRFELGGPQIAWVESGDQGQRVHGYALPSGFSVTVCRTREDRPTSGVFEIPISGSGYGISYAVRVSGRSAHRWVLVAGMTGQSVQVDDESQVERTFEL